MITASLSKSCLFRRLVPVVALTALFLGAGVEPTQRAEAQTSQKGQWSAVLNWPAVAIHSHMLPNGKMFFFRNASTYLWDRTDSNPPVAGKSAGYNIFCSGHSFLPDGRLFVAGGHIVNNNGLPNASIYDPAANTWTRVADMNAGRWYPTCTTLPNGDILVVSGSYFDAMGNTINNNLPQVWQTGSSTWGNLTGAVLNLPLYPKMHLAPDGRVYLVGPNQTTRFLNTSGTGSWTTGPSRTFGSRSYGSSVVYEPGKILYAGGGDPPTATVEVIDLNVPTPAWRRVASLSVARRQHNATVLPDGKVLVTGGSSAPGFSNDDGTTRWGEIWDPATDTWTRTANYAKYRGYHSTAVLLPGGRVASAGSTNPVSEPNAEIYSPPYLFQGTRPTVGSFPANITYNQVFFVGTPNATDIKRVTLVRMTSVTHTNNMDQRFLSLSFTQAAGGLNVTAPANGRLAPPGPYMLFILNGSGVPSDGKIVNLQ